MFIENIQDSKKEWIEVKDHNMETIKNIIKHPLSKTVACGLVGGLLLAHSHELYAGIAFGVGVREFLLALK